MRGEPAPDQDEGAGDDQAVHPHFGMDPQVWINLQGDHDLRCAQRRVGAEIDRIRALSREAA
jgi:plasmid maintenance system antidote protein VapI